MTALTNTAIEAMLPGDMLKDHLIPNLQVRATGSGKSFMLYYRTRGGIQRRPKIGSYPILSIAAARDIAREILAQVMAGNDPSRARHLERAAPDFDALWLRCEAEHYDQSKKWGRYAKSIYHRHLKPKLGKLKVSAIDYQDIAGIHAALKNRPCEANRMVAVVSKMLALAERWGYRTTGSNPCQHVARYKETKRRRYASPDEIRRIGVALDKYALDPEHTSGVAFLCLLMFSGARPSEIGNGTPDMVERAENGAGILRIEQGKTGVRDVFLPPQAMVVLDKLPADRATLAGRVTVPRKLWALIVKDAGIDGLWARDLRRTFATIALTGGVPIGVVGELLGHASTQTTKIYARLLEDGAHKAAASVAGRIEHIIGGGNAVANSGVDPFD